MKKSIIFIIVVSVVSLNISCMTPKRGIDAINVSIQKIEYPNISTAYLEEVLIEKGFKRDDFLIHENTITTKNINIAILVNRIKAFNDFSTSPPYVILVVKDSSGNSKICVTTYPQEFKKDIGWSDTEVIVSDLNQDFIIRQAIDLEKAKEFSQLSRHELRTKYFDDFGGLLISKYPELRNNLEFVYTLLTKGFYVSIGSYSGYLEIEK